MCVFNVFKFLKFRTPDQRLGRTILARTRLASLAPAYINYSF